MSKYLTNETNYVRHLSQFVEEHLLSKHLVPGADYGVKAQIDDLCIGTLTTLGVNANALAVYAHRLRG
jgi:hypothetical protein